MKIAIGCDHIVTDIKDKIKTFLEDKGYEVIDCGTYDFERTHYPIYGKKVAEKVVTKEADKGIVICGTGVGITNAAQKVKGSRVALVGDVASAIYAKKELNCNILGVGGRVIGMGMLEDIIDAYLNTSHEPSQNNKELIKQIDALIIEDDLINDEHYFDEYLEKWERGEYHD